MASPKANKGPSSLVTGYLFIYNFAQVIGWSYLLFLLLKYYITNPRDVTLWEMVKPIVVIFQNAAALEVLHVAFKLVKSNLFITAMQVASRIMVVCGLLLVTPTAPVSPGLPLALLAWSITEIIRYLYYALHIIGAVPYALVWCRYTFFIALYPIGITGELLCFYYAQSYARDAKLWTLELPNQWNFVFNYQYVLIAIMLSYIPFFPQLYLHMFHQRKQIIGGGDSKKKK